MRFTVALDVTNTFLGFDLSDGSLSIVSILICVQYNLRTANISAIHKRAINLNSVLPSLTCIICKLTGKVISNY